MADVGEKLPTMAIIQMIYENFQSRITEAKAGASDTTLGLVKGSDEENKISVGEDFTMSLKALNVNRLVQTDGETVIFDCGTSKE